MRTRFIEISYRAVFPEECMTLGSADDLALAVNGVREATKTAAQINYCPVFPEEGISPRVVAVSDDLAGVIDSKRLASIANLNS